MKTMGALTFSIAFVLCAHAATAETVDPPRRLLNDHAFIPLLTVDWPFADTSAILAIGAGSSDFVTTAVNPVEEALLGDSDLNTLFLTQGARLGVAPLSWLSVAMDLQSFAIVGSDTTSAILFGGHGGLRGTLRLIGQLLRREKTVVALQLGGMAGFTEGLLPSQLLDSVRVENGMVSIDRPRISNDSSLWGIDAGAAAAHAFTPLVGVQGSVAYGYRRLDFDTRDEDSQHNLELGIGGSLDGRTKRLPVAAVAGYRIRIPMADGDTIQQTELGGYYSGRENLSLGLVFNWLFRSSDGLDNTFVGWLRMGYFF